MHAFSVTVKNESGVHTYATIAMCSVDAIMQAFDLYGICSVTVRSIS